MADRAELSVKVLAVTELTDYGRKKLAVQKGVTSIDHLAEVAGRNCYQAWGRENPATRTTEGYLGVNILGHGHLSVLAHGGIVLDCEGISRSLTHELIRHRFPTFSELSQRYVEASDFRYVVPPAFEGDRELENLIKGDFIKDIERYKTYLEILESRGVKGKKAKEAARCKLPNCTETKMVVGFNARALRDFLALRWDPAADAEIHRFAERVYDVALPYMPHSLQDFAERDVRESTPPGVTFDNDQPGVVH